MQQVKFDELKNLTSDLFAISKIWNELSKGMKDKICVAIAGEADPNDIKDDINKMVELLK